MDVNIKKNFHIVLWEQAAEAYEVCRSGYLNRVGKKCGIWLLIFPDREFKL